MSDIKLTESGDFKICGLSERVTFLYVEAFKSKEVGEYIDGTMKTGQNHKLELRNAGHGCGDGVYCGAGVIEPGTVFALYYGTYRSSQIQAATSDQGDTDYEFDIVGKTSRYTDGLKIDGCGSGRRADNVCCLNHSCDNANAKLVRVKMAGIYLVVAEASREIKAGEQITVNYNGSPGQQGYWRKLSDLHSKHPTIPDGHRIIRCLCNIPSECPYNFARLVRSDTSRASDPLAGPAQPPPSSLSSSNTLPSSEDSSADTKVGCKRKNAESDTTQSGDLDAARALLSLGDPPSTQEEQDIILPWTSIPLKKSELDKFDDTTKKLWLIVFNLISRKHVIASTCKPDKGFCGILGFVLPAERVHELNTSLFPSVSFVRHKYNETRTAQSKNEIARVETAWRNACFVEKLRPDGSIVFSYCPRVFGGVNGRSSGSCSTPPTGV